VVSAAWAGRVAASASAAMKVFFMSDPLSLQTSLRR
jgi:hypothetical protein